MTLPVGDHSYQNGSRIGTTFHRRGGRKGWHRQTLEIKRDPYGDDGNHYTAVTEHFAKTYDISEGSVFGHSAYENRGYLGVAIDAATGRPCLVHRSGDRWVSPVSGQLGVKWCEAVQRLLESLVMEEQ